jgi:hypothetical protein
MSVPFMYVNGVFTLVLCGKVTQISPDHPCYGLIKKNIKTATEEQLLELIDTTKALSTYINSTHSKRVTIQGESVYFDGHIVHNTISKRIIEFMKEGLPFKHLLLFLENLSSNPSYNSQKELYDFLEHKNLPITEDGCFLAYKAIRNNWFDKYSGTINNSIGNIIEIDRSKVDDNRQNECSKGLHCGTLEYVDSYGNNSDRLIIVKINPKDVVSVPTDYSYQKLRCCRYKVIKEFTNDLNKSLYDANGNDVISNIKDNFDWSWTQHYKNNYKHCSAPLDDDYDDEEYDDYDEWDDIDDIDDEDEYDDDDDDWCNDDDCFEKGDINVTKTSDKLNSCDSKCCDKCVCTSTYHNKRDKLGRFCKK